MRYLMIFGFIHCNFTSATYENSYNFNYGSKSNWKSTYDPYPRSPAPRAKVTADLDWIEGAVARHNSYRKSHSVPPLKLNMTICEISQAWAYRRASGITGHNPTRGGTGENIYTVCISEPDFHLNSSFAVDEWYNEDKFYDYNTCDTKDGKEQIGHFTQLVWNTSSEIGIAHTQYSKYDYAYGIDLYCTVVVANYYPPGNVNGLYQQNVFPRSSAVAQGGKLMAKNIIFKSLTFYFLLYCMMRANIV